MAINKQVKIPPIITDRGNFFRVYIELLKTLKPFNTMRPKERDMVAFIMYYKDKYKNLPNNQRDALIFSKEGRQQIAKDLNISISTFYNMLKAIRSKGILLDNKGTYSTLTKGKKNANATLLHPALQVDPDKTFEVLFTLKIND